MILVLLIRLLYNKKNSNFFANLSYYLAVISYYLAII